MEKGEEDELIALALEEDVGPGDVTAEFFVDEESRSGADIVAREPLVVAGTGVAAAVFAAVDAGLKVEAKSRDGTHLGKGEVIMTVRGKTRSILTAERTALNFLQRLSGIATMTKAFVDAVEGHAVKILDTRKTTPGWRRLEKAAVAAGGGTNHRMGLYDEVMVKDNHLLAEGNVAELEGAIAAVKAARPGIVVELEADEIDQVEAFLKLEGVDRILLDNMSTAELEKSVAMGRGSGIAMEASGGVTLDTVREIAATGVDFISVGAITHSVRSADISLELRNEG